MSYYSEVYLKRLRRLGEDPQARLRAGREHNFERFMMQSPHYVQFNVREQEGETRLVEGVLEPYRQDTSKTLMRLLCRVGEKFEAGQIVSIPQTISGEVQEIRYMLYYWEERQDSGYNRWVLIRISRPIEWINLDGQTYQSEAYMHDRREGIIRDTITSRSRSATLYLENNNTALLIMPSTKHLENGSYMELREGASERAYRVIGTDFLSTPGVTYVSIDTTPKRDLTPAPTPSLDDDPEDFFWLGGIDDE